MKIAIVGYGEQGRSAYDYWHTDNEITVCDSDESLQLPSDVQKRLGPDHLSNLQDFDLIVRAPIIHPQKLVAANSEAILRKVTTNSNEFFRVCPSKNIIGVTGTKGKGTTSTLIAKILEADHKRVHLGGNIGIPPLDLLKDGIQPSEYIVLELANFQLIDLKHSPVIGVCLLVVGEHLDWHKDMAEYIYSKQQLFRWQKTDDKAIFYSLSENSRLVVGVSPGQKIPYMAEPGALVQDDSVVIGDQVICSTNDLKLLGKHNWQNVCAALTAAWQVTKNLDAIRSVLTSFSGLPFRIEFRREVSGIRYYNDSFASGPPAAIAAIEAVPGQKVMIMGGYDRGLPLDELAENLVRLTHQIRTIVLIGASADRTAAEFDKHGFSNYVHCREKDMASIVLAATKLAKAGDAVVLSPGFASFDMFKNFEDRGVRFNQAVEKL